MSHDQISDSTTIVENYEKFKSLTPIFIGGLPRSGTTLSSRLLDGHPQLLVCPAEMMFLRPFIDPANSFSKKSDYIKLKNSLISKDPEKIFSCLSASYSIRESLIENDLFKHSFIDSLSSTKGNWSIYDVIQAVTYCYFHFIGIRDLSQYKAWVIKYPDGGKSISHYCAVFPQCRILQLVRDPRAWLMSKISRPSQPAWFCFPSLEEMIELFDNIQAYKTSYLNILAAKKCGCENMCVLRYEDLVQYPEKSMKEISGFLEIEYNHCLLQPTLLGKPDAGNSRFRMEEKLTERKIYMQAINRWKKLIRWHENFLIQALLGKELIQYGYMRKIRWEGLKLFIGKMVQYILSRCRRIFMPDNRGLDKKYDDRPPLP